MKKSLPSLLWILCLCVVLTTSCHKDDHSTGPIPSENTPTVTTTIAGIVTDESGKGMSSVVVSAYGQAVATNENGLFLIRNIRVPEERCAVVVRKDGYFTASRAESPKANGVTHMRLGLMRNTAKYSVSASAGGTIQLAEGGSVQLPADGYITANGQPYSGTVKVAARWLNPAAPNFYRFFPGDFAALRTDNSETYLYSYGVLNVELMAANGEKLQLSSGKKAVLTYPIPASMQAGAPTTIPLWYFDETAGIWKEEGSAVKQGSIYVGEVSHFTPWNVDVPVPTAVVQGQVTCNAEPVSEILIKVGQTELVTDIEGRYRCIVPAGQPVEIKIDPLQNEGVGTVMPITVGPLATNETFVQDITVGPCPSYITGTLVDCNNQPTEGIVEISWSEGYGYTYALIGNSGAFRIKIRSGVPAVVKFQGFSSESETSPALTVEPVADGSTYNIGVVSACGGGGEPTSSYTELTQRRSSDLVAFSEDASLVVGVGGGVEMQVYDTQTGDIVHIIPIDNPQYATFSSDGTTLMVASGEGTVQLWNTTSWTMLTEVVLPSIIPGSKPLLHPDGSSIIYARRGISSQNPNMTVHKFTRYTTAGGTLTNLYELPAEVEEYSIRSMLCLRNNGQEVVFTASGYSSMQLDILVLDINQGIIHQNSIGNIGSDYVVRTSANGNRISVCSRNSLAIFDVDSGEEVFTMNGALFTKDADYLMMALSPDGSTFIASFANAKQRPFGIYSSENGALVKVLPVPVESSPVYVDAIQFSPDGRKACGRTLATMHYQRIWHLQ